MECQDLLQRFVRRDLRTKLYERLPYLEEEQGRRGRAWRSAEKWLTVRISGMDFTERLGTSESET